MNKALENALDKCTTLVQFIDTLAEYYDLQGAKPSTMILTILLGNLQKFVRLTSEEKTKALKSASLYAFLKIFGDQYDETNPAIFPKHKQLLISSVGTLLKVTNVKPLKK